MGDGKRGIDVGPEAGVVQSKNAKKNRQKKKKRAQSAIAANAQKPEEGMGNSLGKVSATATEARKTKACKKGLPHGIPREVAKGALEALRAEFVDGAEDCFADFIDANDVSDDVEDLLWPYVRRIGKKRDKQAAIDALEEEWGLAVTKAADGVAAGRRLLRRRKKKAVSKRRMPESHSAAEAVDARSSKDAASTRKLVKKVRRG